jgi:putative ABC transport system permease protein
VVRDITGQVALTSSSLTAVNLSGISRLEEVFAVLLAAASVILFAILTTIERRREFALMAAMGTRLRVMGSFLWTEALLVSAASAMLAAVLGTLLAVMLIAILTHVFDPPPEFLALPWSYLLLLFAATAAGTLVGGLAGMTALYRLQLSPVLRAG